MNPQRPGWITLFHKELLRFWKVSFQTVAAPVLTALLYLLIFSHVLESHVSVYDGEVRYTAFLIPGLVMMSMLQNAFDSGAPSAGAWWYVIPPGLCITVLVLAVSMLGYLFEEHVNPRLREHR